MTTRTRFAVGISAAALALVVTGVGYKDISAQGPGPGGPGAAQAGPGRPGGGPGGPGGPGAGFGRRGGPGGPGGPGGLLGPMMLGRLDLTQDQRDRVRQIMDSHRDEQRGLRDRAMKAHDALRDASTAGTFDESAVRARAAEVAAVDADLAVARARIFSEVYQILTPEQQTTLKAAQERRGDRQDRRRERRDDRRGGQRPPRGNR